jgi:hypothetical protein
MSLQSRREFLESGATFALGLGFTGHHRRGRQAPELVVINARVYTVDDAQPRAEAFAIDSGRFTAVGSNSDIRNLVSPNTNVIDAAGMTVTPGFIDAHSHPDGVREITGVNVNLRTVEEVKAALRQAAEKTPPGYWVEGYMYDDTKLERPVTRTDLDEVVPDHPAMVGHRGGHTGVYNSTAFSLARVSVETPDPEGGRFYRENGELTGKVAERARGVFGGIGQHAEISRDTRRKGAEHISRVMSAAGLTSVHRTGGDEDALTAFRDAHAAGNLPFRLYFFPRGRFFEVLDAAGTRTGSGDEWVRIGAVKYTADGSASERTMRMSSPYVGRPDDYGILTMTEAEIRDAVEQAHRKGWQIGIHANGDVTIDLVLRAYERAQREWPRADARHRIEHCSLVNDELLRRIKAIGVIPTPFYTYIYYHGDKWGEYGEEKMRSMFAHRSFLDHGIPVAGASDYMPGPFEPLMALQSMVTRRDFRGREWGPNQRVTVDEALRICTLNGAFASFEEQTKGSIAAGKLADFVMLAEDPHDVEPDRIKDIAVARTVVGGRTVHEG